VKARTSSGLRAGQSVPPAPCSAEPSGRPCADRSRSRVRIGQLDVDAVTFAEALKRIGELVEGRHGGAVFTPNVDHVVKAERHPEFRRAYSRADLALADGMPLVWASRLLGSPLPEKVSGSDLAVPLIRLAAERRWRVYLLGGGPGVAEEARKKLTREVGAVVVGTNSPVIGADGTDENSKQTLERLAAARPDLVLVAFGAPKQELWIDRFAEQLGPAVAVGVGGSLDFITGQVRRAPAWMSRAGLEWLFRLLQEPRRMWRRYLVEDPAFILIVARTRRQARRRRSP
jgi:N-acetylglucosaminyldiphosphoundecaprenol N-acetyl-beta-D-mannosaminyltransferase